MKILQINGQSGSGKDTLANSVKQHLELTYRQKVVIVPFAKTLYDDLYKAKGLNRQDAEVLKRQHSWVTKWIINRAKEREQEVENFQLKIMEKEFGNAFRNRIDVLIVPDFRRPQEELIDAYKVRVERDESEDKGIDNLLDKKIFHRTVDNNGSVQDLYREAWSIATMLLRTKQHEVLEWKNLK